MLKDDTTFYGRRIGYNASRRKKARKEKVKNKTLSLLKWFFKKGWVFSLLLVFIGIGAWNFKSHLKNLDFKKLRTLKTIEITGNETISYEKLMRSSGLRIGMYMGDLDMDLLKNKILENPTVKSVDLNRSFFSSLKIAITEVKPLMLSLEGGVWKVYSEKSSLLPASIASAYHLPVIDFKNSEELKLITEFLNDMKETDENLYKKLSQVCINEQTQSIEVFFRDLRFKTLFHIHAWESKQFEQFKLLTQSSIADLKEANEVDMRFVGFAYIKSSKKRYGNG